MDRFTSMKIFTRIIQLGSFTSVANEMGLTQSAVSKKMAALEDSLGATLLTRGNRQVMLTEVGSHYYEHCLSILSELEEAEAQTKDYTLKPKGRLRINVPVSFGREHVIKYLPDFLKTYPDIELELSVLDRRIDIIAEGYDLVIRIGQLSDSNLIARKIGASPRVLVASAQYLKEHGTPQTLNDLKQHNCLVYSNLSTVNIWHFLHESKQVSLQVSGTMQANSGDAIRECVLAGLGIGVLPNWLVQQDLDEKNMQVILPEYQPVPFNIYGVYPHNHYTPLKVRCFIDFFKNIYDKKPVLALTDS